MAKSETSKERLLAVERMFQTGNVLTADKIKRELEARHNISVERKTIYSDIKALDKFMPIVMIRKGEYQLKSAFEENRNVIVNTSQCQSCYFSRAEG